MLIQIIEVTTENGKPGILIQELDWSGRSIEEHLFTYTEWNRAEKRAEKRTEQIS